MVWVLLGSHFCFSFVFYILLSLARLFVLYVVSIVKLSKALVTAFCSTFGSMFSSCFSLCFYYSSLSSFSSFLVNFYSPTFWPRSTTHFSLPFCRTICLDSCEFWNSSGCSFFQFSSRFWMAITCCCSSNLSLYTLFRSCSSSCVLHHWFSSWLSLLLLYHGYCGRFCCLEQYVSHLVICVSCCSLCIFVVIVQLPFFSRLTLELFLVFSSPLSSLLLPLSLIFLLPSFHYGSIRCKHQN